MEPWTKCRYSVWEVWKWRSEDHLEYRGRAMVVVRMGFVGESGAVGMWYATAEEP